MFSEIGNGRLLWRLDAHNAYRFDADADAAVLHHFDRENDDATVVTTPQPVSEWANVVMRSPALMQDASALSMISDLADAGITPNMLRRLVDAFS